MTAPEICDRWTKPLGRDCPRSTDGNHHCTTRAGVRHEIHGCACNWVWGGVSLPGPVIDELVAMRAENQELVRENEMHRDRLRELGPLVAAFTEDDLLGELAHQRAQVARLVVAVTDSWPGDSVFADRTELALVVDDAVREAAAVKRERDELKTKHGTEAPQDLDAATKLHTAVRDVIVQRCLSRPVRELSSPNIAGAIADEVMAVVRRAGNTAVSSDAVLDEVAVRMLRGHVYGTLPEPRYDAAARNQWAKVLDEEDRETWRREASMLLSIAGAAADDREPGSFYWTARHQLAEALDHKGVTDASVTFDELVAYARDVRLTWLSDNGHDAEHEAAPTSGGDA